MKAQGISMNFIVIAAMAILVLVLVMMFLLGGFQTGAVDKQKVINECNSRCLSEVQWASTGGTFPRDNSNFCEYSADVKGLGEDITCLDLINCHINDLDCDISCSGSTANCS